MELQRVKAALMITSITGVMIFLGLKMIGYQQVAHTRERELQVIATYEARFLTDQKILSESSLFEFSGHQSDAGVYLNERMPWATVNSSFKEYLPKEKPLFTLDSVFLNQWFHQKDWLHSGFDLKRFDTAWIKKLENDDHWDIYATGPNARMLEATPGSIFFNSPDLKDLIVLAKIRLLQGASANKPLPALQEVQHLARLIYSQNTLVSAQIYRSFLKFETEYAAEMVRRKLMKPQDFVGIDAETELRVHRAMFGYPSMISFWSTPEFLDKLLDGKTAKAGMCAGVIESLATTARRKYFYSENYPEEFANFSRMLERVQPFCHIPRQLLYSWDHPEVLAVAYGPTKLHYWDFEPKNWDYVFYEVSGFLPGLHFVYEHWIDSMIRPSYLRSYLYLRAPGESPYSVSSI